MSIKNIVFDFGGVLIDWNPIHLYENVFTDKSEMDFFLQNICTNDWNLQHDAGLPVSVGTKALQSQHPEYSKEIEMYYKFWIKMIGGEIVENTKLLKPLKSKYRLFGLTNWSAETLPLIFNKYAFFSEFEGIVVSGEEKIIKPNKGLYEILLNRYQLNANESLFIDDNLNNILAAKELGFSTIHLNEGVNLYEQFTKLGLL